MVVLLFEIGAFMPEITAHDIGDTVTVDVEDAGGFKTLSREKLFSELNGHGMKLECRKVKGER